MAIYSESHDFLFLHIPKSAGMSVRAALKAASPGSIEFPNHLRPEEVRAEIGGNRFRRAFKFAFVRTPWDCAVSLYHFIVSHESHPVHELTKDQTFEEYLDVFNHKSRGRQTDWTHAQRERIVDFVGRFETLEPDFKKICGEIGLEDPQLPRLNRSEHASYRSYYSPQMRDAVARSRAREIELFGYIF